MPLSDPAKNQQVYHVNEAFQESDVAGSVNQENGSDSSPNNADGSEEFKLDKASNDSTVRET